MADFKPTKRKKPKSIRMDAVKWWKNAIGIHNDNTSMPHVEKAVRKATSNKKKK